MNKKERELLTELFWVIQENKNEHHILYYSKDVLQSILRGELKIAENLLMPKATPAVLISPKVSPPIPRTAPPTNPSSILTVKKVKKLVTTETENIGNLKNEGGKD